MVTVGHRMMHEEGERQKGMAVFREIFPETDQGKQHRRFGIGVLVESGKTEPGQGRNGAIIIRSPGAYFDAFHVFVRFHIAAYRAVKIGEMVGIFAPYIGKRLIVGVENRIRRHHKIPITEPPLTVESHPESPVFVHGPEDNIKKGREKLQAGFPGIVQQCGDIYAGVEVVLAFDLPVVIIKMRLAFPSRRIDRMENRFHRPGYYGVRKTAGGVGPLRPPDAKVQDTNGKKQPEAEKNSGRTYCIFFNLQKNTCRCNPNFIAV